MQPSSPDGAVTVVKINDLVSPFRERVEKARTKDGWDAKTLAKAVRQAYDFLGPFVSSHVEQDTDGVDYLVVEFTPPADRDLHEAERSFDAGIDLATSGDLETAKARFKSVVDDFPEVARYRAALGQVYFETGDLATAEDELLAALALNGREPTALTMLGNLYMTRRDVEQAKQLYTTAVEVDRTAYNLANLGAALGQLGHVNEAISRFRQALDVDPTYEKAQIGLQLALEHKARRQTQ